MAVSIIHGPNGSYKSASAVWFELVPALREGRAVVTNLEGCYPLDYIEQQLNEKFPDTARLWRIASNTPKKQQLWRHWFCWMPIGVKVIMDEAQDIYPRMKGSDGKMVFRSEDILLHPIETFSEYLPPDLVEYFHEAHKNYKPEFDESSSDDTGEILFDEQGRILYPNGFTMSYMRHRKYMWDILLITPDIRKIHADARGCAEVAFAHASKDSILGGKRKPRIFEHDPKTNGIPSRSDLTYRRFVPATAHLLYKSTQTNSFTKSGAGGGIFTSLKLRIVVFVILPLCFLTLAYEGYLFYTQHFSDDSSQLPVEQKVISSSSSPSPVSKPSVPVTSPSSLVNHSQAALQTVSSLGSSNSNKIVGSNSSPSNVLIFEMPFSATTIFWGFKQCDPDSKPLVCEYAFIMDYPQGRALVYSRSLLQMGYKLRTKVNSDFVTLIDKHNLEYIVTSEPVNFDPDYFKAKQAPVQPTYQIGLMTNNSSDIKDNVKQIY